MQRFIVGVVSGLALTISILWFLKEGGFEPAVTSLAGIAGLMSTFYIENKPAGRNFERGVSHSLNRAEDELLSGGGIDEAAFQKAGAPKFRRFLKSNRAAAAGFKTDLKNELDALARKVDETYYELYERLARDKQLFNTNTTVAERWKLEAVTKMALVHVYVLCDEQFKLLDTIGFPKGEAPIWRKEDKPADLVKKILAGTYQLIRGNPASFQLYLESLGLKKHQVDKLIRFSEKSALDIFIMDGKMNAKKRKIMTGLIKLKASTAE